MPRVPKKWDSTFRGKSETERGQNSWRTDQPPGWSASCVSLSLARGRFSSYAVKKQSQSASYRNIVSNGWNEFLRAEWVAGCNSTRFFSKYSMDVCGDLKQTQFDLFIYSSSFGCFYADPFGHLLTEERKEGPRWREIKSKLIIIF